MRSNWPSLVGRASWPLVRVGALGIVLSALTAVVALTHGPVVPPEGELSKAISFDLAMGIYMITLGFIAPVARFSPVGERRWVGAGVVMALYAYGAETVQQLRGIDPRFSRVAGPVDAIFGNIFALVSLGLIAMFVILAVRLARRGTGGADGLLLLGLRYAGAATMLAFAAGIWMIANGGRHTGAAGNILILHALGFHALQATPLVAWLFSRSTVAGPEARRWVHAAGLAWCAACLGVAWQTALGQPLSEPSPAMLLTLVALGGWSLSAARGLQAGRLSRRAALA